MHVSKTVKVRTAVAFLMCFAMLFALLSVNVHAATTITSNATGTHGGYNYEFWVDNGNGSMTLNDGGAFSCSWSNINNILFRKGLKYNETQTHQQIGNMSMTYACNYQPNGNSYLSVYGWTSSPLVEYYIIESWGTWKPPGNVQSKGTVTIDGGVYDIFETTRTNQPSIKGTATFQQYWSVRQQKRTSGTISISEHFKAWEAKGMKMGKFYEVSLVVEGYQSSGKADVTSMSINIGPQQTGNPQQTTPPPSIPVQQKSAFTQIEVENYDDKSSSTMEAIGTANGGSGIGYIENGDYLVFKNVDFGSGAASFSALCGSEVESPTNIEIRTGSPTGPLLGTLEAGSTGGWDTYKELSCNVSGATGVKDLYLKFTGPVNIDWFVFSKGGAPQQSHPVGAHRYGDVNGDALVNAGDYTLVRRYILGSITEFTDASGNPYSTGKISGDVNADGQINAGDYTLIRRYILGQIKVFPAEGTVVSPPPQTTTPPVPTPTRNPNAKLVALSFDDGPDNTLTAKVLDKLDKYKVPATFMMIGSKVNSSTSTTIKRIVNSGHEIGNHSWGFESMNGMSEAQIKKSIEDTNNAIKQYAGVTPKFFRAPNLAYSQAMYNAIDLTFVQGITANDWSTSTTAQQRASAILNAVKDGTIILLHDVQPLPHPTPEALDIIIPELQKQGYEFVTLTELFSRKGVRLSPTDSKNYTTVP